jgi:predicted ATPase
MHATLEWSYALLTEAEQAMWRRASVFADSFDLRAA